MARLIIQEVPASERILYFTPQEQRYGPTMEISQELSMGNISLFFFEGGWCWELNSEPQVY
jgi:hypothetical protein